MPTYFAGRAGRRRGMADALSARLPAVWRQAYALVARRPCGRRHYFGNDARAVEEHRSPGTDAPKIAGWLRVWCGARRPTISERYSHARQVADRRADGRLDGGLTAVHRRRWRRRKRASQVLAGARRAARPAADCAGVEVFGLRCACGRWPSAWERVKRRWRRCCTERGASFAGCSS